MNNTSLFGIIEYLVISAGILALYTFLAPIVFSGNDFWLLTAIWHAALLSFWYLLLPLFRVYDKNTRFLSSFITLPVLLTALGAAAILLLIAVVLGAFSGHARVSFGYTSIRWYVLPVVILSAYCEEIIFRAYSISRLLKLQLPPYLVLGISALMFSLIHRPEAYVQSVLSGLVLGYAWYRTGNTHCSAISHIIYNFVLLLLV